MTLAEAIVQARMSRPNTFSDETLTDWVSDLEAGIQTEIWLRERGDLLPEYDFDTDGAVKLLAEKPFDKLYVLWLRAMISRARDEEADHAAAKRDFDELYGRYVRYFAGKYAPALLTPSEREALYASFGEERQ